MILPQKWQNSVILTTWSLKRLFKAVRHQVQHLKYFYWDTSTLKTKSQITITVMIKIIGNKSKSLFKLKSILSAILPFEKNFRMLSNVGRGNRKINLLIWKVLKICHQISTSQKIACSLTHKTLPKRQKIQIFQKSKECKWTLEKKSDTEF